jgi:DNA invertase Pin-like site-specific DNA recombinase
MLTVLSGLVELEQKFISTHTGEERAQAAARGGEKMGRHPGLTPHQRREAIR